jgi:hypothetical protein
MGSRWAKSLDGRWRRRKAPTPSGRRSWADLQSGFAPQAHARARLRIAKKLDALGFEGYADLVEGATAVRRDAIGCLEALNGAKGHLRMLRELTGTPSKEAAGRANL